MDTYASLAPAATSLNRAGADGKAGSGRTETTTGRALDEPVTVVFDPALWRLDGTTAAMLRGLWPGLSGELDTILDEFYRFMGLFPENAPHLADKGKLDCLRLLQKEHWQVFFRGDFDPAYLARVHKIGAAHARVQLPTRYLLAGYSFLLERLVRSAFHHHRRRPAEAEARVTALIRAVLMEAYITNEVYAETTRNQQMLLSMQELAETFENELDQAVQFVRHSATDMETASDAVLSAARRVAEDSEKASEASNQANNNAQAIAAGAEELSASIAEISRQVEHSTLAAQTAANQSQGARALAQNLSAVSERIGSIVLLIERIAKETRLLALNANIEAARAGAAGRGFAVVANEVKNLADQTNRATGEIRSEIQAM
jgi:methyl-accepting chemotaxis protein